MSLSGVNTMRDLLSLLLPLILCSSCLANIQCPQNSNFYVYIDAEGNITDVTTNVAISQGSDEAPCKAPNFCWQLVSRMLRTPLAAVFCTNLCLNFDINVAVGNSIVLFRPTICYNRRQTDGGPCGRNLLSRGQEPATRCSRV
uniref:Uncharacterized protein n=1 Tax=Schistocephalus solidus TaxID=70667 RepID=A0A0X3PB90_SCHSO